MNQNNRSSYPSTIEVPFHSPKGFSAKIRVLKSHIEGDVMVIDDAEIESIAFLPDVQSSPTKAKEMIE